MTMLQTLSFAAIAALALSAAPTLAQDAMAPATDAMATDAMAADPMAPMTDDDLDKCLEQAGMITFAHVMEVAVAACHDMHNGVMGEAMGGDAMATDAMAPAKP